MNRLFTFVWSLFNGMQASAFVPKRARIFMLRKLGCSVDKTARVAEGVYIGSNKLTLGSNVFINVGVFLDGSADIYFGEYARIGPFVKILTGSHVYADSVLRRGPSSTEDLNLPVRIERGCWLGMGVMVMPGVTIAEGCVVAAGSLVLKSTSSNGLYAGMPARRIKDLPVND